MAGLVLGPSPPGETPSIDITTPVQPASAILDPDGTLRVYGTANGDNIKITEGTFQQNQWDLVPEPGIQVTIKDSGGQTLLSQIFTFPNYQFPSTLKVYGGAGNDIIENNTAIASILDGGDGHDTLYGGLGNDELFGKAGNDGLFGGAGGSDYIDPGFGDDRILFVVGWNSYTYSEYDPDVSTRTLVMFFDSPATTSDLDGYPQEPLVFQAGQWSLNEVKMIDEAMQFLHHRQGNTMLLRDASGGSQSLSVYRVGYQDPHPSGVTRTAFNEGGNIYLTNNLFAKGPNWVTQTLLHEIGHNWDQENPQWQAFKDISAWTDSKPTGLLANLYYTMSLDGQWWYHKTATFARHYGRTDPMEDFATAFEAYCMDQMGLPFQGTWEDGSNPIGSTVIPAKIAFIDSWLFGMSSNFIHFSRADAGSGRSEDTETRGGGAEDAAFGRVAASDTLAEPNDATPVLDQYQATIDLLPLSTSSRVLAEPMSPAIVDQALLELLAEDENGAEELAALEATLANSAVLGPTRAAYR